MNHSFGVEFVIVYEQNRFHHTPRLLFWRAVLQIIVCRPPSPTCVPLQITMDDGNVWGIGA